MRRGKTLSLFGDGGVGGGVLDIDAFPFVSWVFRDAFYTRVTRGCARGRAGAGTGALAYAYAREE
jgi:hypothetical protein